MGYKVIFARSGARTVGADYSLHCTRRPGRRGTFRQLFGRSRRLLADFPELGTPYRKRPGVRRVLCKPYFIYYRVRREEQVIEIMDYWHAARREPLL